LNNRHYPQPRTVVRTSCNTEGRNAGDADRYRCASANAHVHTRPEPRRAVPSLYTLYICALRGFECIFVNYPGDEQDRVMSPQRLVQSPTSGRTSCSNDSINEKDQEQALVAASPKKLAHGGMLSHQQIADRHKFSKVSFLGDLHSKLLRALNFENLCLA